MVNKVILVGYLGADPEVRYTQDGMMVTNIRIATSEYRKDADGERIKKTEWHRVVFFRRLAEICANYTHKGSMVYIEGRIHTRKWEKDGEPRYTTEIQGDTLQLLDKKQKENENEFTSMQGVNEDDVPF